jgi:hypothetical protein
MKGTIQMAEEQKNQELPGVEGPGVGRVKIKVLDIAAADYVKARDARMKLTEKEVLTKAKLSDAMHRNEAKLPRLPDGTMIYRFDDQVITLLPGKEQLKVKNAGSDPDEA